MTAPEYAPDMSCRTCRQPFWITGESPEARAEAVAAWDECCTPKTAGPPLGEEGGPAPLAAPDAASSRPERHGGEGSNLAATQSPGRWWR